MTISLADIEARIRAVRLDPRGAFHCTATDRVPPMADGSQARSLVLIGTVGSGFWPAFSSARVALADVANPLDTYSARVITTLADALGAHALFPFGGPPWLPFLRWARRAEDVHPSPIGPLIHPRYGLWHAYRGALIFAGEISGVNSPPASSSPCDVCEDKPCLNTCPAGAFSTQGYAVPVCIEHLDSEAGTMCMGLGCLARRACPIGAHYRYGPEHAQFHMQAFLQAQ